MNRSPETSEIPLQPAADPNPDAEDTVPDFVEDRLAHEDDAAAGSSSVASPADRQAERKSRVRRRVIVLTSILVLFALAITGITLGLRQLLGMNDVKSYPGPGEKPVSIAVTQGMGVGQLVRKMKDSDVIISEKGFLEDFYKEAGNTDIQPGSYAFKTKMSNAEAIDVLLKNSDKVLYVPISGNMRISEVLNTLSSYTRIPLKQYSDLNNDPKRFGLSSKAKNLEGYIAPGEYRFKLDATPEEILKEMVQAQLKIMNDTGVTDPDQQYTLLTKASIVEAEGNPKNYDMIAGALDNRVYRPNADTGGFINSDATVTYGLGKRTLHLSDEQKQDTSNPYNTYANKGLPVGPIGSPAKAAIVAAAHPKKNPYYYWVTVNIKTGETLYARNYAEHQQNEQKYFEYCSANPGVCG